MASFKDREGRAWELTISVTTVKRIRLAFSINILDIVSDEAGLWKLLSDVEQFVDLLWMLVEKQAQGRGVDDEAFGESLFGDCILDARDAFLEALTDFFPDPKRREAFRKMIELTKSTEQKILEQATEEIEAINVAGLVISLTNSVGNSPEKSESTPAR